MNVWESRFEQRFLFLKDQPLSIEEINQWAFDFALKIQSKHIHSRHGMTRFQAFLRGIEGHLKILPGRQEFNSLFILRPKRAKVTSQGLIRYKGKTFGNKMSETTRPDGSNGWQ